MRELRLHICVLPGGAYPVGTCLWAIEPSGREAERWLPTEGQWLGQEDYPDLYRVLGESCLPRRLRRRLRWPRLRALLGLPTHRWVPNPEAAELPEGYFALPDLRSTRS